MKLSIDRVRRLGGAAGVLSALVILVAFFLPGSPPKADEVFKIAPYFADKHDSILTSNYLLGIGFFLFLIFLGGLRAHLAGAEREGGGPATIMVAGGAVAVSLIFAGAAVLNGAAFQVAGAGDTNLNHALYDVSSDLFIVSGFSFAAFFVGAALAGALPRALASAGLVVAVLNVLSGVALFATSGFLAIGGVFSFIVPLASLFWVLAASIVLLRPARAS